MIRLLIADDHAIVRTGLRQLAATLDGVELVAEAANGEEAVVLCEEHSPDVVLIDLEMPVLDGIGATQRITDAHPRVAVVVLTSFSDRQRILGALDAGAVGYVLKDVRSRRARSVRCAHAARGEAPLDPRAGQERCSQAGRNTASPLEALSEREREVLALVDARAAEQADRSKSSRSARRREGAHDEGIPCDRRDGSDAGGALGRAAGARWPRVVGPKSHCRRRTARCTLR